ncbi:DNA helicase [Gracilaria domingensis]|nr:DNA helicase [Gracilaria domingensis]
MNRFLRGSRFRTAAITMSSESTDSSITRLQSLQRTLANRGKSLRAQGIRGKADAAAEKERKFLEEIAIEEVPENLRTSARKGMKGNETVELESATSSGEDNRPQTIPFDDMAARRTKKNPSPTPRRSAAVQSEIVAAAVSTPVRSARTAVNNRSPTQTPASARRKLFQTNVAVKASSSLVKSASGTRSTSDEALLAEDLEQATNTLADLTLNRRYGKLPWKDSVASVDDVEVHKQTLMPMLESFTKDQGFTRLDGSLPWVKRPRSSAKRNRFDSKSDATTSRQSTPDSTDEHRRPAPSSKDYGPISSGPMRGSFVKVGSETDKREVISRRFALLVNDRGVSPSDILVVTISNKNANDIKARIGSHLDEVASDVDLQVRTFHSLCVQLLRCHGDRIGIRTDFDICGASDSTSMLNPIIQDITGVSARSKDLKRYRDLVPKLKNDLIGNCKRTWLPSTFDAVEKIRVAYDEALREVNQMDFVDVIVNTHRMLSENPGISQDLRKLYAHVLVDDWRGANYVHANIMFTLSGTTEDLFVASNLELSAFRLEKSDRNEALEAGTSKDQKAEGHSAETILNNLNPTQLDAVIADPSRACLVMAGPGSGKTRVLTHRFAYLVKAHRIPASQILAVTFTNKAANEMKERIEKLVGHEIGSHSLLSIGTFHSICLRLLRLYGDRIDIPNGFNICDTSDSRSLLTSILKKSANAAPSPRTVGIQRDMISKLKNDSDGVLKKLWNPYALRRTQELRVEYDKELRRMNLLDFDDLLLETRRLLLQKKEVLQELCDHYHQVLVDEWQDTNTVQFEIVSLLAQNRKNLFVVGDIDQSIYKFRGADVKNVKRFHHKFKKAVEVSLDQNYRSTEHIVNAAHAVIAKNREGKNAMTTEKGIGRKVQLRGVLTTKKEAEFVSQTVQSLWDRSEIQSFSDISVLYRTNAQSRAFEEAFIACGMPYRLHSGVRFFDRQEVKDVVSYLKVVANVDDDMAFRRIVNTPTRGIGKKTVDDIERFADTSECSMADAVVLIFEKLNDGELELGSIGMRASSAKKLGEFYNLLYELRKSARSLTTNEQQPSGNNSEANFALNNVGDLVSKIIDSVGYEEYIRQRSANESPPVGRIDKTSERMENIAELRRYAAEFSNVNDFLDNVSLVSESDRKASASSERGRISMMTLHGGKGLEFPVVFIVGAEDNMIPIGRAASDEDVEEERRLFYVGMTRAQKLLFISWRKIESCVKRGKVTAMVDLKRSRFVDDIPESVADTVYDYEDFANG